MTFESTSGRISNIEMLASRDARGPPAGAFGILKRAQSESPGLETTEGMVEACRAEWREIESGRAELVSAILRTLMTYRDIVVAESCAMALATEGEQGLSALIELHNHEHGGMRNMAFLGLGFLDRSSRWALPQLLRSLSQQPVGSAKAGIVFALGHVGGIEAKAALSSLVEQLKGSERKDQALLVGAEEALARCQSQEAPEF